MVKYDHVSQADPVCGKSRVGFGMRVVGAVASLVAAMLGSPAHAQCDGAFSGVGVPGISGDGSGWLTGWDPDGPGATPELMIVGSGPGFKLANATLVNGLASWVPPNAGNQFGTWAPFAGGIFSGGGIGQVWTMQPVGTQMIFGGEFDHVGAANGVAAANVARYDGPTNVWIPYHTGTNGPVYAVTLWNGQLFIGGGFTRASGATEVNGISRWDGSRWRAFGRYVEDPNAQPPVFHPGLPGTVLSLAVLNNVLYAGGLFAFPTGPLYPFMKYDAIQNLWVPVGEFAPQDPLIPLPVVWSLYSAGGVIYVGGSFTEPSMGVVKFNGAGFIPMNGGVLKDGGFSVPSVYSITLNNNEILLGGDFDQAGVVRPVAVNNLVRWTGTEYLSTADGGSAGPVTNVGIFRNQVGIMGPVTTVSNTHVMNTTWFDGNHWIRMGTGFNGPIYSMILRNNKLIAAGYFSRTQQTLQAASIAEYDGNAWSLVGQGLTLGGGPGGVYSLCEHQGKMIAGGEFDGSGLEFMSNIGEYDGTKWKAKGYVDGPVYSVMSMQDRLFCGGDLVNYGNIAEYDGFGWTALTFGVDAPVVAMTEFNSKLVAGGMFTLAGGIGCNLIGLWDLDLEVWNPMGQGFNLQPPPGQDDPPASVYVLKVIDGQLYAGGRFNRTGNTTVNHIARWTGAAWQAIGAGVPFEVWTIQKLGNFIYAGGQGGQNCAYWDGAAWRNMDGGTDGPVWSMLPFQGAVYLGGSFILSNGQPGSFFSKWTPDVPLSITAQPQGGAICPGSTVNLTVGVAGTGPITYQWKKNNVNIVGATSATYTINNAGAGINGSYTVVVSNGCSTLTSNPAVLTICPGDFNCDGFVDFFDFGDFADAFDTGNIRADFNGDGFIDFFDFGDFVDAFEAGC